MSIQNEFGNSVCECACVQKFNIDIIVYYYYYYYFVRAGDAVRFCHGESRTNAILFFFSREYRTVFGLSRSGANL